MADPTPRPRQPQHNAPTIRISVGRQLFVDDFLIESTTLQRRWHQARVLSSKPVLRADEPWEEGSNGRWTARPFGGWSLLDPRTQRVLLWYRCGWRGARGQTCVATSRDGVTFTKPKRGANAANNVVIESEANEAMEVVYDHLATPPRFECLRNEHMPFTKPPYFLPWTRYTSSDGLAWRRHSAAPAGVGMMADRSTFYLNPLRSRSVWTYSLRENLCRAGHGHMRIRRYAEQPYAASAGAAGGRAGRGAAAAAPWRSYVTATFSARRGGRASRTCGRGLTATTAARARATCTRSTASRTRA